MAAEANITRLLHEAGAGRAGALDEVMSEVYADLERLADIHLQRQFGRGAASVTLEPAALVNESFMRLIEQRSGFESRGHFFAIATRVMLRVLVDYRRHRSAVKRGGDRARITLTFDAHPAPDAEAIGTLDVEAFAGALDALDRLDTTKADIVRLRVIGGLTVPEIGRALDVSASTVERGWRFARAWLAESMASARADEDNGEDADGSGAVRSD